MNAAKTFGSIDFLILNGDLLDFTAHPGKYENIYKDIYGILSIPFPIDAN